MQNEKIRKFFQENPSADSYAFNERIYLYVFVHRGDTEDAEW